MPHAFVISGHIEAGYIAVVGLLSCNVTQRSLNPTVPLEMGARTIQFAVQLAVQAYPGALQHRAAVRVPEGEKPTVVKPRIFEFQHTKFFS